MELLSLELNKDVEEMVKATFQLPLPQEEEAGSINVRFSNLLHWLGIPPAYTTLRVNTLRADGETVLESLRAVLAEQCKSRQMDPFEMSLHPALKDCIVIKNRRPHQTVKPLTKEVIVDLACGMAVLRGADVFVQGIMAAPNSMQSGDTVSVYCDLDGQCRKGWTQRFTGHKMFVGYGQTQIGRSELFCSPETPRGVGVRMTSPVFEAPSLDQVLPDLVFAQNLPSIVCGHVLDPQPGETILDMCAAPGGKTVHIATLMQNKGRVVAIDKTAQKVSKIQQNASSWGVTIIETHSFDSRKSVQEGADVAGGPPYPPSSFDRILLDAPCSALGQRPSTRNKMKPSELRSYSTYQRKLFSKAVDLLKPGGFLVFSTCTVTREENEGQVEWALKTYPTLQLESQSPHIGGPGLPGTSLTDEQLKRLQRFDPSVLSAGTQTCDTDTIGFFIARFQKTV